MHLQPQDAAHADALAGIFDALTRLTAAVAAFHHGDAEGAGRHVASALEAVRAADVAVAWLPGEVLRNRATLALGEAGRCLAALGGADDAKTLMPAVLALDVLYRAVSDDAVVPQAA